MFTIGGTTCQVILALGATDLRRGFNGLYTMIQHELAGDPLSGTLYVFCNKARTMVKVFFFDRGGIWVCAKRLEEGTFRWPRTEARTVQMNAVELELLLSGMELTLVPTLQPWWTPGVSGVQPALPATRVGAPRGVMHAE